MVLGAPLDGSSTITGWYDKNVSIKEYLLDGGNGGSRIVHKKLRSLEVDYVDGFSQRSCRGGGAGQLSVQQFSLANVPSFNSSTSTGPTGGNIPTAIEVRGNTIFISSDSATSSDADIWVIDISNRSAPKLLAALDTGPGIIAEYLVGNILYVANTSVNAQLQAIDVSDLMHPKLTWSYKVPGSNSATNPISHALQYWRGKIFLGTIKTTLPELYELDVSSGTTTQPALITSAEIGAGINDMYSAHDLLFIATPLDPELSVLDASSLRLLDTFDAPGAFGNGKHLDIWNNNVFLGRTVGGDELMWLGQSTAGSTGVWANASKKISHSIDAMITNRDTIYMLADNDQKEFQVWHWQASSTLSLQQGIDLSVRGVGLSCGNRFIAVALSSSTNPFIILSQ